MGGYKILDSFPLTAEGWAAAWQSLAETEVVAAEKVAAKLAGREALLPGSSGRKRSAIPSQS